jgi:HEPN domain-containing protein
MNRNDFQQLSNIRIEEAILLLDNKKYEGAYYLAGYAIECALKACIAKNVNQYDFFPKPEKVKDIYSHKLEKLITNANLLRILETKLTNRIFARHWEVVKQWDEESRYATHQEQETKDIIEAITDKKDGVLPWLKTLW